MSRRVDNVFFFVLVDFFLQVLFLVVVLYGVDSAAPNTSTVAVDTSRVRQIERIEKYAGIGNVDTLIDILTRLVPVDSVGARRDSVLARLSALATTVSAFGGLDSVTPRLKRLGDFEHRVGIRPCVDTLIDGKRPPLSLAAGVLTDSTFEFVNIEHRLQAVFDSAGVRLTTGKANPLTKVQQQLRKLRVFKPACSYRVDVVERTPLLAPVKILWRYVQLNEVAQISRSASDGR